MFNLLRRLNSFKYDFFYLLDEMQKNGLCCQGPGGTSSDTWLDP